MVPRHLRSRSRVLDSTTRPSFGWSAREEGLHESQSKVSKFVPVGGGRGESRVGGLRGNDNQLLESVFWFRHRGQGRDGEGHVIWDSLKELNRLGDKRVDMSPLLWEEVSQQLS